jgi:hypothetical protein
MFTLDLLGTIFKLGPMIFIGIKRKLQGLPHNRRTTGVDIHMSSQSGTLPHDMMFRTSQLLIPVNGEQNKIQPTILDCSLSLVYGIAPGISLLASSGWYPVLECEPGPEFQPRPGSSSCRILISHNSRAYLIALRSHPRLVAVMCWLRRGCTDAIRVLWIGWFYGPAAEELNAIVKRSASANYISFLSQ